jgi:disulfide bond formation protein DsbB
MSLRRFAAYWPAIAALAAAVMLAAAHGFETFGGYPPCELCLKQRDVYWVATWSGLALWLLTWKRPSALPWACLVLALIFLAECGLAVYHAGVEWRWWPGPTSCTGHGVRAVTPADMDALLSGKPQHVVQCDVAAFRLMGLSMAGWNALAALGLSTLSLLCFRGRSLQS